MPLRTAERLRAAIAAGDHTSSSYLLEDFRQEAECAWKDAVSPEQRRQVADEVHRLLRWARETVLATRSHQQGKLLQFTRARAYLGAGAGQRDHLELDA